MTNDAHNFNIDTSDSLASEWGSGNLDARVNTTLQEMKNTFHPSYQPPVIQSLRTKDHSWNQYKI